MHGLLFIINCCKTAHYATKSSGLLNPPFLFMYCLYFRFRITCTAPTSFPSTFFPFVVSKLQKPISFIISCSSAFFPSKSAAVTAGLSGNCCCLLRCCSMGDRDRLRDLVCRRRPPPSLSSECCRLILLSLSRLDRSLDLFLRCRSRSLSRSLFRSRSRSLSPRLRLLNGDFERLRRPIRT